MKTEKQRKFAAAGGLFAAIYLTVNRLLPTVPEFFLGLLIGLTIVFLVMGLLPEESWSKVRKWKRRGK